MTKVNQLKIGTLILLMFFLSSCLVDSSDVGASPGSTAVLDPNSNPSLIQKRLLCDPFATNSLTARDRGLVGSVSYLTDDQPRYTSVVDYISKGKLADVTLYLDRILIQSRPSDGGFVTTNGDVIQTIHNANLYQYYAMNLDSQLQLGENEEPGYYQLAIISDEGAVLKLTESAGMEKVIVNNDGSHPSKMACATEKVFLDRNSKIPLNLSFYQGSKENVALIAMWRPWPEDDSEVDDFYCGKGGDGLFFHRNQNPIEPKKQFYELLARNWKILENENFHFPNQDHNPCAPVEEMLKISGFTIGNVSRNSITLTWNTNIAATSQGEWKDITRGTLRQTEIDQNLVQTHSVRITGLLPDTFYSVRAYSTTAGGQRVFSDERAFRTPR